MAQWLPVDQVRSVEGITTVEITERLLLAAGGRQKHCGYLDGKMRTREQHHDDLKREALADNREDLKKIRAGVGYICTLEKSVDEYAVKAEGNKATDRQHQI